MRPERTQGVSFDPRRCLQDLFDGIDNDALLINDCNDNQMPHHWLGDGFCDDGSDVQDGGGDCALIA